MNSELDVNVLMLCCYYHLQIYVKENKKNSEVYSLLANKKQTAYFSTNANAANHPELLMLVKFCFDHSCT